MTILQQIGQRAANGLEKQAFGAALRGLGSGLGRLFSGAGRLAGKGVAGAGALGLLGSAANEQMARGGLPHLGGTDDNPLWSPDMHRFDMDPSQVGFGNSLMNMASRPYQTLSTLFGGAKPLDQLNRQDFMTGHEVDWSKLKFDPMGKVIGGNAAEALTPTYHPQWNRLLQQRSMMERLGMLSQPPAAAPAVPSAHVPADKITPRGPTTMDEFYKTYRSTDV